MKKFGIDKTDKNYTHFVYDDEAVTLNSPLKNIPAYAVFYIGEEKAGIGYVSCDNVMALRKTKDSETELAVGIATHQYDALDKINNPILASKRNATQTPPEAIQKPSVETSEPIDDVESDNKESVQEEPKKRGRKKTTLTLGAPKVYDKIDDKPSSNKFEYKTFIINTNDIDELRQILNEHGESGWKLCSMQSFNGGFIFETTMFLCVMIKEK